MDWLSDHLWAAWLAAGSLLLVAEMFSLDLVLGMLAVGAVVGMALALAGAPFVLQALVAAGASVAMLALVRPSVVKRLHRGPDLRLGHHKLLGERGLVTQDMTGLQVGRVRLAGEIWSAAPYDEHEAIAAGQTVEVVAIRGATAYVLPVPSLEA